MAFWPRLRQRAFLGGFIASLLTPLTACDPATKARSGLRVGVREMTLAGTRGGEHFEMPAVVWYPTTPTTAEKEQRYDNVFIGLAAPDAALAPQEAPRPLVLLAHGLRGTKYDLSWLGERLAQAGYIAVSIEQPGVSALTYDKVLAPKIWRRTAQLSVALDALLKDSVWGAAIDAQHVAVVGHSAGGSAVLAIAGAQVDEANFLRRYGNCGPVPASGYDDPRFGAVVGLAPGTGRVFTDAGLHKVNRPVLLVSGDQDWVTPEPGNAARYAAQVPHARWERLAGTGHYVFKPVCNFYGKLRARGICNDGGTVDRAAVHDQVSLWVRSFLAQAMQQAPAMAKDHTDPEPTGPAGAPHEAP